MHIDYIILQIKTSKEKGFAPPPQAAPQSSKALWKKGLPDGLQNPSFAKKQAGATFIRRLRPTAYSVKKSQGVLKK